MMTTGTNIEKLSRQLAAFPRLTLAEYPTPLEPLPRLSSHLGRTIYIKRDDLAGPALGGNKIRKLEYLMAEACQRGARKVVTFGGLQSNHARLTAAVARQLGLEPHLFYFERRPQQLKGNLLLNELLAAQMHFIPLGGGGTTGLRLETVNRLVHWLAWLRLGPHYFIPVGGHSWRGCLGYVQAAIELDRQCRTLGLEKAWLVVAAGTGGTLAGLLAGIRLSDSTLRLLGIDIGRLWKGFAASIAHLASQVCHRLGQPAEFTPADIPLIEAVYTGQGYGLPSPAGNAAIRLLAQLEGILLDPIYTGKAFAGLLDQLRQGRLGHHEPVIFLHTGGLPALFTQSRGDDG